MAKGKKRQRPGPQASTSNKRSKSSQESQKGSKNGTGSTSKSTHKPLGKIKVPFVKRDNILLLGEGDFSFSLSLLRKHGCKHLTATSYDDHQTLVDKYPTIQSTLDQLNSGKSSNHSNDGLEDQDENSSPSSDDELEEKDEDEWEGFSPDTSESTKSMNPEPASNEPKASAEPTNTTTATFHSIDARKIGSSKEVRKRGPFDKIVFNFPHIGGVSKDVNRQVRLNQELLVGFFKSCKGLLASPERPALKPKTNSEFYETDEEDEEDENEAYDNKQTPTSHGQVILTVFEGEPYTLWNVRDLARHSGFKVIESFRFPWEAYSGYKHARTIGDIQGREREDGRRSGAWRGEERDARSYIFELDSSSGHGSPGKKSRKAGDNDDSD